MFKEIPFIEKVLSFSDLPISSFHALPIAKNLLNENLKINNLYKKLLGEQYLKNELTYGTGWIDNPIFPEKSLLESEKYTAIKYHVDDTLYFTTGTTSANQVSIFSNIKSKDKVLVDRSCHQSIHFALSLIQADVYYTDVLEESFLGYDLVDYESVSKKYKKEFDIDKPFKMVILNGSSYDGRCPQTYKIINQCLSIDSNCIFLVDEAWLPHVLFSKKTAHLTILNYTQELKKYYPKLKLIVTQSAHKGIRSLRQGSYLHSIGEKKFIDSIHQAKYMFDTTSPDYVILASLELARKDIVDNGNQYITRSLNYVSKIKKLIDTLDNIVLQEIKNKKLVNQDPLKITINFGRTKKSLKEVESFFKEKEIYISRYFDTSFLLNFHISITEIDYKKIVNALIELNEKSVIHFKESTKSKFLVGSISKEYIIPYPPGVPIIAPGERFSRSIVDKIYECEKSGIKIIKIGKLGKNA